MSITDELREFIESHLYLGATALGGWKEAAFAIADRIDEAHESSYKDGYDEGAADILAFCDRLKEAAQGREDVTLWGVDYVALPVDADGVPIRVGDEMEPISVKYDRFGVVTLCLDTRDGRWSLLTDLDGEWSYDELCQLRHYHAPKVEDVLREFAEKVIDSQIPDVHPTYEEAIAEYAKRLRLAEREDS